MANGKRTYRHTRAQINERTGRGNGRLGGTITDSKEEGSYPCVPMRFLLKAGATFCRTNVGSYFIGVHRGTEIALTRAAVPLEYRLSHTERSMGLAGRRTPYSSKSLGQQCWEVDYWLLANIGTLN